MNWEDYVIKGSNVLKNKLGITNQEELTKIENEMLIYKLTYLYLNPINGDFDSKHLSDLHRFLFEDLYEFAGSYRAVPMFKKYGGFLEPEKIKEELDKLFFQIKNKEVNENNKFEVAKYISDLYISLINIHPFREGNGRTIREFIREFTSYRFPNYSLDLTKIDKKNFLLGIVEYESYPSLIAYEIYNALVLKEVKTL